MGEVPAPTTWKDPFTVRLLVEGVDVAFEVEDPAFAHVRILQELNSLLERSERDERFYAVRVDTDSEFVLLPAEAADWLEGLGLELVRLGLAGEPVPPAWLTIP